MSPQAYFIIQVLQTHSGGGQLVRESAEVTAARVHVERTASLLVRRGECLREPACAHRQSERLTGEALIGPVMQGTHGVPQRTREARARSSSRPATSSVSDSFRRASGGGTGMISSMSTSCTATTEIR